MRDILDSRGCSVSALQLFFRLDKERSLPYCIYQYLSRLLGCFSICL